MKVVRSTESEKATHLYLSQIGSTTRLLKTLLLQGYQAQYGSNSVSQKLTTQISVKVNFPWMVIVGLTLTVLSTLA